VVRLNNGREKKKWKQIMALQEFPSDTEKHKRTPEYATQVICLLNAIVILPDVSSSYATCKLVPEPLFMLLYTVVTFLMGATKGPQNLNIFSFS
jgi:hypothetical protein